MRSLALALAVIAVPASAVTIDNFDNYNPAAPNFSSAYTYVAPTFNGNTAAGQYTVATSAYPWNSNFADYADVTGGSYMVLNGAGTTSTVWSNNTPVALGQGRYKFGFYLSDACCNAGFNFGVDPSPPVLAVKVNGTTLISNLMLPANTAAGTWVNVSTSFTLGSATNATFEIVNNNPQSAGNDYGIDAISVTAVPEPAQWGLMLLGLGTLGATARRRRQRVAVTFA